LFLIYIHTIKGICSRGIRVAEQGLMIGSDKGGLLVGKERGAVFPVMSHVGESGPSNGVFLGGAGGRLRGRGGLELGPVVGCVRGLFEIEVRLGGGLG
jgi:hypothetical protein